MACVVFAPAAAAATALQRRTARIDAQEFHLHAATVTNTSSVAASLSSAGLLMHAALKAFVHVQ